MTNNYKISFYMLVKDSETYLDQILNKIQAIADQIVLVDSGSLDRTEAIAKEYGAEWHFRAFDNFKEQRSYALSLCQHPYVFFLDDDEIPNDELLQNLQELRRNGFLSDAYAIEREWVVMGRVVKNVFPVECPDYPIRLVNKNKASFSNSTLVHESYSGFQKQDLLKGKITHITFSTKNEISGKLHFYTDFAAQDLAAKNKSFSLYKIIFNPAWAWCKWYFIKGSWKDGTLGLVLSNYVFKYNFFKYLKLHPSFRKRFAFKPINTAKDEAITKRQIAP